MFSNIEFTHPYFFLLLLLLPLFGWLYKKKYDEFNPQLSDAFQLNSTSNYKNFKTITKPYLILLAALSFLFMIFALARPQKFLQEEQIKGEGIDIVLSIDLSSSMLSKDFEPDRLESSKEVAIDFIKSRKFDRIGLVTFAAESITQCPITNDHNVLIEILSKINCGILQDGTAIGMGLANAVNRLKESDAKSKIVILLTDGVNNQGYIVPETAAEIARELNIKVYTIGVGTMGQALAPIGRRPDGEYVFGLVNVEIDEKLLLEIAETTGGKYFRALNKEDLSEIYKTIDKLEKTEREISTLRKNKEIYYLFLIPAFLLFALYLLLQQSYYRQILD